MYSQSKYVLRGRLIGVSLKTATNHKPETGVLISKNPCESLVARGSGKVNGGLRYQGPVNTVNPTPGVTPSGRKMRPRIMPPDATF